jgi:Ca2+-binding RTX toxin-like protein
MPAVQRKALPVRRFLLVPIATVVLLSVPNVARASTATSCTFDGGTATVTATIGSGQSPTLERSGDAIVFDGGACGAATVTNTDTINVSAPDHVTTEGLTVSIAGGQFAPGKTAEVDGTDEIEIALSLDGDEPLKVVGSSGPDTITMRGYGTDLTSNSTSGEFEITYPLTTATKSLDGGAGDDTLRMDNVYTSDVHGGPGDDTIEAAIFAPSTYDGGADRDTIRYTAASGVIVHATAPGAGTADRGGGAIDTLTGVEKIVGSYASDTFYGSQGSDWFDGAAGNDWFLPWGGDDHVEGGDGFDTMSVGASMLPVTFDLTSKTANGEGADTFDGIEVLQGSPNDDVFAGDPELALLVAIDGFGGKDLLDLRTAQSGQTVYTSDVSYGPTGVVLYKILHIIGSPFRDKISVYQTPAIGGSVHFSGMGGNDVLVGGPRRDRLEGGGGDDRLNGKGGVDTCLGGPGTDTLLNCEA